jgi:transcriptional regulator with XRE-family HTH domain
MKKNIDINTAIMIEESRQEQIERTKEYINKNQNKWFAIGQMMKEYREEHNLSIREMSVMIGYSETTLRKFEKGMPVIGADKIKKAYSLAITVTMNKGNSVEKSILRNCVQSCLKALDKHDKMIFAVVESENEHKDDDKFIDAYGERCHMEMLKEIGRYLINKERWEQIVLGEEDA